MKGNAIYLHKVKPYLPWNSTSELFKTILAFAWLLFCTFSVTLANVYVDTVNKFVNIPSPEIYRAGDPLLDFLSPIYIKLGFTNKLPGALCDVSTAIMIIRVILGGKNSFLLVRRVSYIVGMGYLIRIPFILMTMLPIPLLDCKAEPNPNIFNYLFEVFAQKKSTCGDVVFSGHTISFMSASLIWVENPVRWFHRRITTLVNFSVTLFSTFGVGVMIASTFHYTVDCVIASLTMIFLWKFYHFVIATHYFDDYYFGRMLIWLDGAGDKRIFLPLRNSHPEETNELYNIIH